MKSFVILIITGIICSLLFISFAPVEQSQFKNTKPSYTETSETSYNEETSHAQETSTTIPIEIIEETTVSTTEPETIVPVETIEETIATTNPTKVTIPKENERFQKGDFITANTALNFRDSVTYELISTAAENDYFEYIGLSTNYPERIEVYYCGKQGTILNSDKLTKLPDFEKDVYFATNSDTELNLRISTLESEPIAIVPAYSCFEVLGTLKNDSSRILVKWHGMYGTLDTSYIERITDAAIINRSIQKLFLVRNGELLLTTDCVTGQPQHAPTPAGHFKIWYMGKNEVLKGTNWSTGTPYEVPVKYLIAFCGDYCIHDNSGRNVFGGNIYKTNGSNGCVNLPEESARILYENSYKGMSVLVF